MNASSVKEKVNKLGWDSSIYMAVWNKIKAGHKLTPDEITSAMHLVEKNLISITRTPIWNNGSWKGIKVTFSVQTIQEV